jgi:NAD(P)-dependent dehydrogenase (short-subunit alcohol dehydrogenase family)
LLTSQSGTSFGGKHVSILTSSIAFEIRVSCSSDLAWELQTLRLMNIHQSPSGTVKVTNLEGAVAIVTGGATGIGHAIAADLAARGASVVIGDQSGAEPGAQKLKDSGYRAIGVAADVSSEDDVRAMVSAAQEAFGRVDLLVNNAAIFSSLRPKPFEQIDIAEFRRIMDVNVIGMFLCCKAVVPAFERQGSGRIINISSGVAFKGNPLMAHYVASKGAVVSLTRALATELGPRGILVNSVAPGFTLSDNVERNAELVAGAKEPSLRGRVLARSMTPADLVGAVAFFASADSAFITGQTLVVDGGAYFH